MNVDNPATNTNGRDLLQSQVEAIVAEWTASGQPDTTAALERYPNLQRDKSKFLDLAYEEYALRVKAGQAVDPVVARRVQERAAKVREELRKKGTTDVAVALIREVRDE